VISFQPTDEQTAAQSMARAFAREVLAPAARAADEKAAFAPSLLDQLWGLGIAQARADEGASCLTSALMLEELAAGDAAAAIAIAGPLAYGAALSDGASPQQVAAARTWSAGAQYRPASIAVVEPSPAFDVAAMRTAAVRRADAYVLNGAKCMVPFAGSGAPGELVVLALLDGKPAAFVVPAESAGVTRSRSHATLGLRALRLGDVRLDDVVLPASALLAGPLAAQRIIDAARTGLSAILTGTCRAVHSFVIPYTLERVVHGEALARKQTTAFRIADMHIEIEAMRWMDWRAAVDLDKKRPATRSARLAQAYAGEHSTWITDEGVQMLGGHGFTREYPVELWYRNARSLSVLEGLAGV
jgi:alkylation response protein AidB-like acyl-CoA dehydrogenase